MADTHPSPNHTLTALLVPLDQARSQLAERITEGQKLTLGALKDAEELETAEHKRQDWHDYNLLFLTTIFSTRVESDKYRFEQFWDYSGRVRTREANLSDAVEYYNFSIRSKVASLQSLLHRLDLYPLQTPTDVQQTLTKDSLPSTKIFIGHGHSLIWHELKDYIQDTLHLPIDEFNREPVAGISNKERLQEMLSHAACAFLIMTAEDEHADATLHARENVIHETGLFQGRLGFKKAIVLLEEGCKDFSNIHGMGYIPFPKGNIGASFERVRRVLEREGILKP